MAQINLLPWREERRELLKKEFLTILAVVAVAGILLVFLFGYFVNLQIDNQGERNAHLSSNIKELSDQVTEISELEERKAALLDRMKIIQDLQGNRPVIVRVFDELVRTVPDGLYYERLKRTGDKLEVNGVAESSNRVSSLMRRLDGSDWFSSPNLTGVKANPSFGEQGNDFELKVKISSPAENSEDSKSAEKAKRAESKDDDLGDLEDWEQGGVEWQ